MNINENNKEKELSNTKNKHAKIYKFKPKAKPPTLQIKFIKLAMKLAKESYDGKFSLCEPSLSSNLNEVYKPKFYCLEYDRDLYAVTRGSKEPADFMTDADCIEVKKKINGKNIYFHRGFYEASNYIFNKIENLLNKNHRTIYFIGHSYGAAVSSVLCLLAKSDTNLKNKKIYCMAFAPSPAMSYCPSSIASCIFAFINRNDIVPSFCLFNTMISACMSHLTHKTFIKNSLKILKLINNEWVKLFIHAIEANFDLIANIGIINVKNVKGVVFKIGANKKKRLLDCKINESQLPSSLVISLTSIVDHSMSEYIKSFDAIQM